jgi:hypothetical protein
MGFVVINRLFLMVAFRGDSRLLLSIYGLLFFLGPPSAARGEGERPLVEGPLFPALDRKGVESQKRPASQVDPRKFWGGRRVFQKRGIVVEDKDYIVRERYWWLDDRVIGRVVDVVETGGGWFCRVEFDKKMRANWQQKGFERQPEREWRLEQKRDGYKTESFLVEYRGEGVAVPRYACGLVVEERDGVAVVDFPSGLLSPELPRANDWVVRGPDWMDGYVDGAPVPIGPVADDKERFSGVVKSSRNSDGQIEVEWSVTGRTTVHRFDDARGFVDIDLLQK